MGTPADESTTLSAEMARIVHPQRPMQETSAIQACGGQWQQIVRGKIHVLMDAAATDCVEWATHLGHSAVLAADTGLYEVADLPSLTMTVVDVPVGRVDEFFGAVAERRDDDPTMKCFPSLDSADEVYAGGDYAATPVGKALKDLAARGPRP